MKNLQQGLNGRFDMAEERISEFEVRAIEMIQSEEPRETQNKTIEEKRTAPERPIKQH